MLEVKDELIKDVTNQVNKVQSEVITIDSLK